MLTKIWRTCMRFELRSLRSESSTVPLNHRCQWLLLFTITQVTVTVFKTSRHSKLLFFVKKQRTMERKKRSKGRGWESCYVKKIYGTFGVEMRAYGRNLSNFANTHTHTHTHARARACVCVCVFAKFDKFLPYALISTYIL